MNERARAATAELASAIRSAHLVGLLAVGHRDEYVLQRHLGAVLPSYARREVDLGDAGRIDFMVRCRTLPHVLDVGVEVKVDGGADAVLRQLATYLEHPDVAGIVLVTTKAAHRGLPRELHDKPIEIVWLRDT
jgi:hypothetical protein